MIFALMMENVNTHTRKIQQSKEKDTSERGTFRKDFTEVVLQLHGPLS